jgi:hypothetical protein
MGKKHFFSIEQKLRHGAVAIVIVVLTAVFLYSFIKPTQEQSVTDAGFFVSLAEETKSNEDEPTSNEDENSTTDKAIDEPKKKDIEDGPVPLSVPTQIYNWSLLSLLLGCLSVLLVIVTLFVRTKGHLILKLIPAVLGIVPIILFFVLDDVATKLTLVNENTPVILVFFIIHLVATTTTRHLSHTR